MNKHDIFYLKMQAIYQHHAHVFALKRLALMLVLLLICGLLEVPT